MEPTLDGFLAFAYAQGVPNTVIVDDTDPNLIMAYNVAVEIVNQLLQVISPTLYVLAVYNLAMHNLIVFGQDKAGAPVYQNGKPFFAFQRGFFNLNGNVFGVVTSTSDEGTSTSLEAPDFVKNLSLADLEYLKDPFGTRYVEIAQRCGLTWGLS